VTVVTQIVNVTRPVEPTTPGIINIGINKDIVRAYYESGQYDTDLWALAGDWTTYWTTQKAFNRSTVVFDIDDTVLSNMPEILSVDFGYIPNLWDAWVNSSAAPAIAQTVQLFNYLKQSGYYTILLTGRKDTSLVPTTNNLNNLNITGYNELILRLPSEYNLSATQYKSQRRRMLQMSGAFNIVGCIGDQISDCAGGFAGYIMKVPNYAYFIEWVAVSGKTAVVTIIAKLQICYNFW